MSWTTPADIRAQAARRYARGALLSPLVTGCRDFPWRLPCKAPTAREIGERFDEVRAWAADLRALPHIRVVMRTIRHRSLGTNTLPAEIWIDTLEDALALAGKTASARAFTELVTATEEACPALLDWLAHYPLRALDLAPAWGRVLAVVGWIAEHPRPGLYLRQVDVPGIDSKFLEAHGAVLTELFDRAAPEARCQPNEGGDASFAARYGFRERPVRIRVRPLDRNLPIAAIGQDITLDALSLARQDPGARHVIITENEVNFLALPEIPGAIALFGAGYGFAMLKALPWLTRTRVHYWGDIDTHGFAILDQLRAVLPNAQSLLMDEETLLAFEPQWGREDRPTTRDLARLTQAERRLYDALRDNRIRPQLRLEQERIGFQWVKQALARQLSSDPAPADGTRSASD
ncbi:Wadjet anti-phage system protein JetD domain-containing protein [Acidiferrobacter sp.]|uniref:Wadjet anti-phage system protein JetD domain-containing protein n=1 Tax=Acidiferrobacter sp. TaxID=1872107 RepID=UPI00260A305C|nr:Wadjet anti-phage system protein JetD domain-containing protein [Acidiferrobacter sp.]